MRRHQRQLHRGDALRTLRGDVVGLPPVASPNALLLWSLRHLQNHGAADMKEPQQMIRSMRGHEFFRVENLIDYDIVSPTKQ